jgi:large subunit ribosomal protein L30
VLLNSAVLNYQKCSTVNIYSVMSKLKITQVKSGIDRSEDQKRTLKALGLKMYKTIELDQTPQVQGMIAKVQHLLKIENI